MGVTTVANVVAYLCLKWRVHARPEGARKSWQVMARRAWADVQPFECSSTLWRYLIAFVAVAVSLVLSNREGQAEYSHVYVSIAVFFAFLLLKGVVASMGVRYSANAMVLVASEGYAALVFQRRLFATLLFDAVIAVGVAGAVVSHSMSNGLLYQLAAFVAVNSLCFLTFASSRRKPGIDMFFMVLPLIAECAAGGYLS